MRAKGKNRFIGINRRTVRGEVGFTLVELLITISLVALFFTGVIGLVTQGFNLFALERNFARLNREGNKVLDRVEAMVRGCTWINDAGMLEDYSRNFDFFADIDEDESTGFVIYDEELGEYRNVGESIRIYREEDDSPELSVSYQTGGLEQDQYDTVITGLLDPDDTDALHFRYFFYNELTGQPEEVFSNFNGQVDLVRVSVSMKLSTGGETDTEEFTREIALRVDR